MLNDSVNNTNVLRRARVRWLAGNLTATDISDVNLDPHIEKGDYWIKLMTNKTDWVSGDLEWEHVIEASNLRAAAVVRRGIPGDTKADGLYKEAMDAARAINRLGDEQGQGARAGEGEVYAADYRTEPLTTRED